MGTIAIEIFVGALIGIACMFIGKPVEKYFLSARDKEFRRAKYEDVLTAICMAAFGAWITVRIPVSAEMIYIYLLLILTEIVTLTDIHHRIIPNEAVLMMLVLKLLFGIPSLFGIHGFATFNILDSIIGLVAGFVIFSLPAVMSKQVGAGDIKLAAAVGFNLGLMGCMTAVIFMGVLVVIYALLQRSVPLLIMLKTLIPLGPFLAMGMIIVLLLPMELFSITI